MLNEPHELMAAYFAGVLDPAESDRLADWISSSESNARTFARFAIEQHALEHLLRVEKYGDFARLSQHEFAAMDEASQGLAELDELRTLSEMEEKAPLVPVVLEASTAALHANELTDGFSVHTAVRRYVFVIPRTVVWCALAAMLMVGVFIAWQYSQPQADPAGGRPVVLNETPEPATQPLVVAVLEDQSDSKWLDGERRAIGTELTEGDYLLSEGTIRLRFNNGALVLVEAPSRFSLDSGSIILLEEGRLVSHCEERAHGFRVRTPYGDFIDLGTEFGVSVTPWRESQLHVFHGEVEAVIAGHHDSQGADSRVVHTSEAVAIGPIHRRAIQPLGKADPDLFDSVRRRVVASINTGSLMDQADLDQQWLVTQLNQRPVDPPLPAALFVPPTKQQLTHGPVSQLPEPIFLPNRPGERCWIKPDPSLTTQDVETTTYATSFDLEGYDAGSARIDLGFIADNYVSAIRLNGRSIPISGHPNAPPYVELHQIKIQDGFLPGRNRIEVVVTNGKPEGRPTYTGLVAELSITAQPDWITATKQRPLPN